MILYFMCAQLFRYIVQLSCSSPGPDRRFHGLSNLSLPCGPSVSFLRNYVMYGAHAEGVATVTCRALFFSRDSEDKKWHVYVQGWHR